MSQDRPDQSQRLNEIIADYLQAVEAGASPERDELLAAHADLADELQSFFAEHDRVKAAASTQEEATLPPVPHGEDATLPPNGSREDATPAPISNESDTAQIGTHVRYFGDYELLDEIARGGMGVVYQARQVSLNRIVALKMILAGQLAGEEDVKRFHAEAEAAANLDHPGIVPIYEIGEHEGQHYFSMGYVEGESLADKIRDGPLPPREAAEYVRKVAAAVAFAHERGVIHRDLKPGNVLIDRNGDPKVTDFGLAKRIESDSDLTATGQILGTPSYMPPEQATGKVEDITEAADVYALGAILYALVTGRPPFQADNSLDTLLQVLERDPLSPRQLNPKVPQDLETICLKCLEKSQHRRYSTSRLLGQELQRFLNNEPIEARPITAPARAWRWCQRKPFQAGLIVAIGVFLFAILATMWLADRRIAQQRERSLYLSNMQVAHGAWSSGRLGKTESLLNQYFSAGAEDYRGWEWYFLQTLLHDYVHVLDHGTRNFQQVVWSSDGESLFTLGHGGVIHWDATSGESLGRYNAQREYSGEYLNLVERDTKTPRSWKVCMSVALSTLELSDRKVEGWTCPLDKQHAVAGANSVEVFGVTNGQLSTVIRVADGDVSSLAWSPDGAQLAIGTTSRMVQVWDAHEYRQSVVFHGHVDKVTSLAWSPDGKQLASGSAQGVVKVWKTRRPPGRLFQHEVSGISTPIWSPDGRYLAWYDGSIKVAAVEKNGVKDLDIRSRSFAWSPDSQCLAIINRDGTIEVVNVETSDTVRRIEITSRPNQVRRGTIGWHVDGRLATAFGDGRVHIWRSEEDQVAYTYSGREALPLRWSPNGRFIFNGLKLCDSSTGEQVHDFYEVVGNNLGAYVTPVWSPDSNEIAVASGFSISICSLMGSERLRLDGHENFPMSLSWSPKGNRLASGGMDGTAIIWDLEAGEQVMTVARHAGGVTLNWSPDGRRLAVCTDESLTVWDATLGYQLVDSGKISRDSSSVIIRLPKL